ncbi:hypothetical protein CC86DRAFT_370364 [Ophiobolus disseminans]|uniref:Uncharacterized protein n=1 Tax=Ophiobolus disseminans TaxID=1469910 RepID=A0A6A7A0C1_9PLEO|nr:hypothetical protein CC86DRAFT_370364 [Ophiobolus disseminans]
MSTHFNAPRRIGSFYSSPVDQEQWKFESRKVYNTDLALLQYHTLGIAQGLGHDLPRAHNLLSDYGIDARGKVLFPAPGTKNIRVSALLGFVCASMACWIFTYEIREGPTETTLLITVVLYSIWTLMVKRMPANLGNIWAKLGKPGSFDELAHMLDATVRRVKQCLGQS